MAVVEKKSTRVQLELPEKSMTRLADLKEKTEATSYAEVVKNSLRLYEDIIKKYEDGYSFVLVKDNKEIEYKIF